MTLLEELKILVKSFFSWIVTLLLSATFFFSFPEDQSLSVRVFLKIKKDLLPNGVELVTTNPMSAFVTQVMLSFLLALLVTAPFFLYKFILYLRPALLPKERRALWWTIVPFTLLFLSGAVFSYLVLIPITFNVLYPFATIMGVVPYFHIDEFIYYVSGLMVAVGVIFLLPIFMVLLSATNLVEPSFWLAKRWQACLVFLILSAIITPDGTGVTMIILFVPLMCLYLLGYVFAQKFSTESQPVSD